LLNGHSSKTAQSWVDAFTDTFFEAFKQGLSVTLPGFGGFHVKKKDGYVFRFNPGQKLRALFGWSSTYTGKL